MAKVSGVVTEESIRGEGGGSARSHTSEGRGEGVTTEVDKWCGGWYLKCVKWNVTLKTFSKHIAFNKIVVLFNNRKMCTLQSVKRKTLYGKLSLLSRIVPVVWLQCWLIQSGCRCTLLHLLFIKGCGKPRFNLFTVQGANEFPHIPRSCPVNKKFIQ